MVMLAPATSDNWRDIARVEQRITSGAGLPT